MNEAEETQRPRRPYVAPTIEKVELRPQEAVLGFCKSTTVAGPVAGKCKAVGACATLGS